MIYRLRNFQDNYQIVSSTGWVLIIIGCVAAFFAPVTLAIASVSIGILLVWLQLRGKRIIVDTETKQIRSGRNWMILENPERIYINRVRVSQTVNSRVSSTHVKVYLYKAYIKDGSTSTLISCNKNLLRDEDKLARIANDLNIPLDKNY